MGRVGSIAAYGRILCLTALALAAPLPPAHAVTRQSSFQVSAFVMASCALPVFLTRTDMTAMPMRIACGQAPAMSAILAPPPRTTLHTDESGDTLLVMEF